MHERIVAWFSTHLPRLDQTVLCQVAQGLLDAGIVTPTMPAERLEACLSDILAQIVAQIVPSPVPHQTAGDGAIQVGGHVINSRLTTLLIQSVRQAAIPWFQIPPIVPELEADASFLRHTPDDAAHILFASMPHMKIPEISMRLAPESQIPPRSHRFVGRSMELSALAQTIHTAQSTITAIITGEMGIGKTGLVLEFAHRYGAYFAGGIFWVDCTTPATFTTTITQAGVAMGLCSLHEPFDHVLRLVQTAWQQPIPRLVVFDHCDDPAILAQHAPTSGGSRIVVTTRRTPWRHMPWYPLMGLVRSESIQMLQAIHPQLIASDADDLAALGRDTPLALVLAGYTLRDEYLTTKQYTRAIQEWHAAWRTHDTGLITDSRLGLVAMILQVRHGITDPDHSLFQVLGGATIEALLGWTRTICEALLGMEHLHTAQCIGSMASLYQNQGRHAEAEPLYHQAVTILTQGPAHPDYRLLISAWKRNQLIMSLALRVVTSLDDAPELTDRTTAFDSQSQGDPDYSLIQAAWRHIAMGTWTVPQAVQAVPQIQPLERAVLALIANFSANPQTIASSKALILRFRPPNH